MTGSSSSKSKWSRKCKKFIIRGLLQKAKSTESILDLLLEADANLSSALSYLQNSCPDILGDGILEDLTYDWKKYVSHQIGFSLC